MHVRRRTAGVGAMALAAMFTAGTGAVALASSGGAERTSAAAVPVVTVHMAKDSVRLSGGGATNSNGQTTLHAGRVQFHLVTKHGDHVLMIMRFHNGYTPQQAQQDFDKAFNGDKAAIKRLDDGVIFRGGSETRPSSSSVTVVTLRKGQYFFVDENSNGFRVVNVKGTVPDRAPVAHTGHYTAFTYGWGTSKTLPASGVVRLHNQADQPHFLEIQRVKESTTRKQVAKAFSPDSRGAPNFVLKANASSAVISPNRSQLLSYDLPAGKYVIACFWPDRDSGMPHALMGMWKIVHLS